MAKAREAGCRRQLFKFMRRFETIVLFLFVFLHSCNLNEADIEEQSWKYSEGFSIGDQINFNDSTFSLSGETILLHGKPAATILSSKIRAKGL